MAELAGGQLRSSSGGVGSSPSVQTAVPQNSVSRAGPPPAGSGTCRSQDRRGKATPHLWCAGAGATPDFDFSSRSRTPDQSCLHGRQTRINEEADGVQHEETEPAVPEEKGEARRSSYVEISGSERLGCLLDGRRGSTQGEGWISRDRDPPLRSEVHDDRHGRGSGGAVTGTARSSSTSGPGRGGYHWDVSSSSALVVEPGAAVCDVQRPSFRVYERPLVVLEDDAHHRSGLTPQWLGDPSRQVPCAPDCLPCVPRPGLKIGLSPAILGLFWAIRLNFLLG